MPTLSRTNTCNLRTQLNRIIRRAGLKPWPKLFQNLRSTRETELAEKYPLHVVCEWMGNTQPVAAKHYLQVTDEHFELAASDNSALQNALQQVAESPRIVKNEKIAERHNDGICKDLRTC